MNKIFKFLKLTNVPFEIFTSNFNSNLPPQLINHLKSQKEKISIFSLNKAFFYGVIKLENKKYLIIGPIQKEIIYNIKTSLIFSFLSSSEEYVSLKEQLTIAPKMELSQFTDFVQYIYHELFNQDVTASIHHIFLQEQKPVYLNNTSAPNFSQRLISAIKHGQAQTVISILRNPHLTVNSPIKSRESSRSNVQFFFFGRLQAIANLAHSSGVSNAICQQITSKYVRLWESTPYSASHTGHLLVEVMLDFTNECQKVLFLHHSDAILKQAIKYIADHINDHVSRKDIADALNISPSYLSHHVHDVTGKSITDLINKYKINQAQYLLETSSMKIIDISDMLGYKNVTYFNRVFLKETNMTPSKYRLTH